MVNYVNDSSNVEPFLELLSTLDANAAGVDYVAGMGTGIIIADNQNDSINLGHNSDMVLLGAGNDYVTVFSPSLIAMGSGSDTIAFEAANGVGPMRTASLIPMELLFFKGAGDAETTPSTPHDFLAFYGYGACASLKLESNNGHGQQTYEILNGAGKVVGEFGIDVTKDKDGAWHTLSASSDYKFYN